MRALLAADALEQIKTFLIKSLDGHLGSTQSEFADHLIKRRDSTLIPDVR